MAIEQGTQDVVFAVNRFHDLPGTSTSIESVTSGSYISTPAVFSNPWTNILNGHPSVQGRTADNSQGHQANSSGGINLWVNLHTSAPTGGLWRINCIGFVNLAAESIASTPGRDSIEVKIGTTSNSTPGSLPSGYNVYTPTGDHMRLEPESSVSRTWMLQLTDDEHSDPESPSAALSRHVCFNFDSYVNANILRYLALGELFFGQLYKPPSPSYPVGIRVRPSMRLSSSRDGWAWGQRIRQSSREFTLTWSGLTIAERIELMQFAGNMGDPMFADAASLHMAPRVGLNDFGSPMLLSLHEDAFSTSAVTARNAAYVVLDPSSVQFRQPFVGRWDAQMKFLEVV